VLRVVQRCAGGAGKINMIALTDHQLGLVMTAATGLPADKRSVLLERVAARLRLRGRFDDADVEAAVRTALQGLVQESAA
jgi:hypothetical protein